MQSRLQSIENAKHTKNYHTEEITNILPMDFNEQGYLNANCGNLIPLEENQIFDLGGITLKVIELPGHTPGQIGLLYEEEKILYVGDATNPFVWLFMPEALMLKDYIATVNKAKTLPFEHFIMSHHPHAMDKETLDHYLDCAEQLNFDKGYPFDSPMAPHSSVKLCTRKGYNPDDIGKPGYASIVISKEHL